MTENTGYTEYTLFIKNCDLQAELTERFKKTLPKASLEERTDMAEYVIKELSEQGNQLIYPAIMERLIRIAKKK